MKKFLISAFTLSTLLVISACNNSSDINSVSNSTASISSIEAKYDDGYKVISTVDHPKFWDKMELIRANDSSINPEK